MSTVSSPTSVNSLCRGCLDNLDGCPIYDLFVLPDLAETFTHCTSLLVDVQDGYPRQLCASCYARLNDLHDFKNQCVASLQRFKEMVATKVISPNNSIDLLEPLPVASSSNEAELLIKDEELSNSNTEFDPLTHHNLELVGNEEDVFKLLEHVDKDDGASTTSPEDDVPLAQRLLPSETLTKKSLLGSKRFTCKICGQTYKKQSNYDEHMKHHNGLLPYQCSIERCQKGFTTPAALRLHVDYAHMQCAKEIPCTVESCTLVFPRLRLLTIHLKKVHNMTRASEPRVEQMCSECGLLFRCPVAFKKHKFKHTGEQLPYPCNICGKAFHFNSALKNHLLRHAGIKNHVCPYCGVGKTTRQEWSKHMLTHTQEKMFKCEVCEHATHTKRALDNHVKTVHEKIRNYACQYCGKTFGKSHACKIHEMTHTGEKRCECKVCGKKFLYTESLTKHLKIHEKSAEQALETYRQRQPECDANTEDQLLLKVCAESVATIPRDPRRVERVDISQLAGTVVNPIPDVLLPSNPTSPKESGLHYCPVCNQGFNNLGNMKRHYKSVHEKVREFECRFCAKRFANSQSLKQHEWIHTGEKPYACKTCGTNFRQEAALIRHQKVHEEKPAKPEKLPKQITEKCRQKELQKCEKRRNVAAMRQKIAEAAEEELEQLAKQRQLEKQLNTYEQYQAAAAAMLRNDDEVEVEEY